jgi:ubiquinone biosynthesis protein Coq4
MRGWALGKRAKPFFGFDWAKHWSSPLADVRKMLDVNVEQREAEIPVPQTYVYEAAA